MKRPAFQFYPADWRKDAALQSCSLAAQGLWVNMLCIAHECEPYGHLVINGRPMTAAQIGRLVGVSAAECQKLLDELLAAGVVSTSDDGAFFSRRMVRDEEIRNRRAEGGKAGAEHGHKGAEHGFKGGRPAADKGGSEPPFEIVKEPPSEPPPSSSSSSSSSSSPSGKKTLSRGEYSPEFEAVWRAYPESNGSKKAAFKAWCARLKEGIEVETLAAGAARYAAWCVAEKKEPRFIKHASTFFGPDEHYKSDWTVRKGTNHGSSKSIAGMNYEEGIGEDGRIL